MYHFYMFKIKPSPIQQRIKQKNKFNKKKKSINLPIWMNCMSYESQTMFVCVCVCMCVTGVTMKLMDEVAGIVAARHCNTNIVTASVDAINFHRKIKKGEDDV